MAFSKCVAELENIRKLHMKMVADYILKQKARVHACFCTLHLSVRFSRIASANASQYRSRHAPERPTPQSSDDSSNERASLCDRKIPY